MSVPKGSLPALLGRFGLWLFPLLLAWLWLARSVDGIIGWLAVRILRLFSTLDLSYEVSRSGIRFILTSSGAALEVLSDSQLYSWGVPIALALLLASRSGVSVWHALLFVAGALFCTVWGLSFGLLNQLLVDAPFALMPLTTFNANAIALAYQFGTLIFPGVVPVLLTVVIAWTEIEIALGKSYQYG